MPAALEPVRRGDAGLGVVAVADQSARSSGGMVPSTCEVGGGDLVDRGGVVAGQVGLVHEDSLPSNEWLTTQFHVLKRGDHEARVGQ